VNSICATVCGLSQTLSDFFLRNCPLRSFSLREIGEGACLRFQICQSSSKLAADVRHKPVSYLGRIKKSMVIIVPGRIEGVSGVSLHEVNQNQEI
jgi:hypothetical protein